MELYKGKLITAMTYPELIREVKAISYNKLSDPEIKIDGLPSKIVVHYLLKELNVKKYEEDLAKKTLRKAGNWRRESTDPQYGEVTLSRQKITRIEAFTDRVMQEIFSPKKDKFQIMRQIIK
jgi:hypothetical protein